MKQFEMTHKVFIEDEPERFDEETAPDWLTSRNSIKGSTMDMRWFWNDYILTLEVGENIETDFRRITRIS